MMHIHKKVLALMMALMMVFSCAGVAYAAEIPEETVYMETENAVIPASATDSGVIFEYENGQFYKSSVSYFKSTKTGKLRLGFGGIPLTGVTDGTITITLYVENLLGTYANVATYSITADGNVYQKSFDDRPTIYEGENCMLVITATSTKTMVVAGFVGVI